MYPPRVSFFDLAGALIKIPILSFSFPFSNSKTLYFSSFTLFSGPRNSALDPAPEPLPERIDPFEDAVDLLHDIMDLGEEREASAYPVQ
jgi:hypothetical protein